MSAESIVQTDCTQKGTEAMGTDPGSHAAAYHTNVTIRVSINREFV